MMDPDYVDERIVLSAIYTRPSSEHELFVAVAGALRFPDYFGFNWDALHECLCDLTWFSQQTVILVHAGGLALPDHGLTIYRKLVAHAMSVSDTTSVSGVRHKRFVAICAPRNG